MNWLDDDEIEALEGSAKREVIQSEEVEILSYSRLMRAGTSVAFMRQRGWAPLPDGRAGLFRPATENEDEREHCGPTDPDE